VLVEVGQVDIVRHGLNDAQDRVEGPYAEAAIASQDAYDAGLADALPRQAEYERVELLARQGIPSMSSSAWPRCSNTSAPS
jgi:hypothetical protein